MVFLFSAGSIFEMVCCIKTNGFRANKKRQALEQGFLFFNWNLFFTFENFAPFGYYQRILKIQVMIIFTVMKRTSILILLILPVFFSSCTRPNVTDHSYTLEEYRERGMPEHDTVWSIEDYETAFLVLNTLKYEEPFALPARDSEKSGMLFDRMMNLENLTFLEDDTLPLHQKAQMIKWWVNIYHQLRVAYTNVGMRRQYNIRELADIDIFGMGLAQMMLDLGQEVNESEDRNDAAMAKDFPAIQEMYVDLLSRVLERQQHASHYPPETFELLSDSLSSSVRRNMGWFDEDASERIRQGMLTVLDSTSSWKIRSNYGALIEIL
jgi:hypothetical protein